MKETPFFKFDTASWLGGSIQFTSLECKGLFIDLCALYWETQKPVKIDTKLKVRLRCDEGTLSNVIGTLIDLGIISNSEAGITIDFLDELMQERKAWLEKCSKAGKKSAKRQGTSSNKKEERRKKKEDNTPKPPTGDSGYTAEFENFWISYERKGSKSNAFKSWKKLNANDRAKAVEGIKPYFKENPEAQYRKDAQGYLSGKLFESALERAECGNSNQQHDHTFFMPNAQTLINQMDGKQ
jgi:hypothetical protein